MLENSREPALYLWVNRPSVIIGRNQNIYKECDLSFMSENDILPVRRLTGGGAVYHDTGNLNYSFVIPNTQYDVKRQNSVVLTALKGLGIRATSGGRNDIEVNSMKAGGAAYKRSRDNSLHHGTILIALDKETASRALTPSHLKLNAKGVDSVKRRILNLSEIIPSLTVSDVAAALKRAFGAEYGIPRAIPFDAAAYRSGAAFFSEKNFIFGSDPPFDLTLEARLDIGTVALALSVKNGVITDASLSGDYLDEELGAELRSALVGTKLKDLKLTLSLNARLNALSPLADRI